jgi:hypothetical protein
MKFTVPVGAPPEPVTLTVAVNVTACVVYRLLLLDVRVAELEAGCIVSTPPTKVKL